MKSTSGKHYIALDHIRALAAFIVFAWHFVHATKGYPVPFDYLPALFPLAIFDEGHTGVALFMTLSGYLFAKLLDGKSIIYPAFIWNRILRLLPLLILVIFIVGIKKYALGENLTDYIHDVKTGYLEPNLPNGGWSITVEFHFYVILPILLWLLSKSNFWPISIIVFAIALRTYLYHRDGSIQFLAYFTIIGRIDQFVLGMLAYHFRIYFAKRHLLAIASIVAFMIFYWNFDRMGGFYKSPYYPSPRPLWIFLPTIEGIAYSIVIAWYDNSFIHKTTGISKFIGKIGEYSYSIYLLHFFVVFEAAKFINEKVMDISNFYLALIWSIFFYFLMMVPGYLSFRFIEGPFLTLRKRYEK